MYYPRSTLKNLRCANVCAILSENYEFSIIFCITCVYFRKIENYALASFWMNVR